VAEETQYVREGSGRRDTRCERGQWQKRHNMWEMAVAEETQ